MLEDGFGLFEEGGEFYIAGGEMSDDQFFDFRFVSDMGGISGRGVLRQYSALPISFDECRFVIEQIDVVDEGDTGLAIFGIGEVGVSFALLIFLRDIGEANGQIVLEEDVSIHDGFDLRRCQSIRFDFLLAYVIMRIGFVEEKSTGEDFVLERDARHIDILIRVDEFGLRILNLDIFYGEANLGFGDLTLELDDIAKPGRRDDDNLFVSLLHTHGGQQSYEPVEMIPMEMGDKYGSDFIFLDLEIRQSK